MRLLVAAIVFSGCAGTQYLIPAQFAAEIGADHGESSFQKSAIEAVRLQDKQSVFVNADRLRDIRRDGSDTARVRSKQTRLIAIATVLAVFGAGAIIAGGFAIGDVPREERVAQQNCAANPGFFCGFGAGLGNPIGGIAVFIGGVALVASLALYGVNATERPEVPAGKREYTYLRAPSWRPAALPPPSAPSVNFSDHSFDQFRDVSAPKPTSPEAQQGHNDADACFEH
jgi:hypothetical protein